MAEIKRVDTHPAWADWLGVALGALIVLTPSLTADAVDKAVQLTTTFIGLLILFTAFAERIQMSEGAEGPSREWEEVLEAVLGAGLIALPFVYGYSNAGSLRYWHFALGGIVMLLAIVDLRRDYVADMKKHGWQS
jgi:hypothetical protein